MEDDAFVEGEGGDRGEGRGLFMMIVMCVCVSMVMGLGGVGRFHQSGRIRAGGKEALYRSRRRQEVMRNLVAM